jgi:hypothetical protein
MHATAYRTLVLDIQETTMMTNTEVDEVRGTRKISSVDENTHSFW